MLNAGEQAGVTGFQISSDERLVPIIGSTQPLSGPGAGAAEVERSPDGRTLVVTEKATNRIGTYPVAKDGSVGTATFTTSAGETPFGFAFDPRGRLFASEAFGAGRARARSRRTPFFPGAGSARSARSSGPIRRPRAGSP